MPKVPLANYVRRYIGMDIGYIDREAGKAWLKEAEEISRMLHALIRSTKP